VLKLEREAAQETRRSRLYTDMTVAHNKSISVLHRRAEATMFLPSRTAADDRLLPAPGQRWHASPTSLRGAPGRPGNIRCRCWPPRSWPRRRVFPAGRQRGAVAARGAGRSWRCWRG